MCVWVEVKMDGYSDGSDGCRIHPEYFNKWCSKAGRQREERSECVSETIYYGYEDTNRNKNGVCILKDYLSLSPELVIMFYVGRWVSVFSLMLLYVMWCEDEMNKEAFKGPDSKLPKSYITIPLHCEWCWIPDLLEQLFHFCCWCFFFTWGSRWEMRVLYCGWILYTRLYDHE